MRWEVGSGRVATKSDVKKFFTTVTPFSRTVALIMFALFPVLGFAFGSWYQRMLDLLPGSEVGIVNVNKKTPEKILQRPVDVDVEGVEVLMAFAKKDWSMYMQTPASDEGKLLVEALVGEKLDEEGLAAAKGIYKDLSATDAATVKAKFEMGTKVCLAEAIWRRDLAGALKYCGIGDVYPRDVDWENADDVSGDAQVLPYVLAGLANYRSGNTVRANYYLTQVLNHQKAVVEKYGDNPTDEYARIIEFVSKLR
jgi:hypothetical protein